MFYRMTRRVMTWWRLLNPPQGAAVEPLPKLKKVKVSERKAGRARARKVG